LQLPIDTWERLEVKVNGIDLSLSGVSLSNFKDAITLVKSVNNEDHGSSYLRLLSLLVYELLGGPRAKVASEGRFRPLAALSEDGNAVLRRGISDDFSSGIEMAEELIAVINAEATCLQSFPNITVAPSPTAASEQTRSKLGAGCLRGKPPFFYYVWRLMFLVGLLMLAGILLLVSFRLNISL
jgi:hypothetical protein